MQQANTGNELDYIAFRMSPAPLIITSNRQIQRCNNTFSELFGYPISELEGELILKLYPCKADFYAIGERCRNALKNTTTYEDERFMQHRSGQIFWARARGITLTPADPFEKMVWSFDRIRHSDTRAVKLTPREQEVAGYLVNGLTCKETAQRLDISHRTVEVHRARLMKKLDAKNTADLVSKIIMVANTPSLW